MTLFLTHDELVELTGVKQHRAQIARLDELGVVNRQRGDGVVLVLRAHIDNMFGGGARGVHHKRVEPELRNAR